MGQPNSTTTRSSQPFRFVVPYVHYIVRAQPGQIAAVQKAAEKTLIDLDRARVIDKNWTLTEARADAYQDDRGLVVILGVVCAALVAVTAFGIVGLTSYWVAQRRRQIGIRRALGATRQAIVRYFQTENFLIAAAGSLVGVGLAVALNLWMVTHVRDGAAAHRLCLHRRAPGAVAGSARGALARAARRRPSRPPWRRGRLEPPAGGPLV